MFAVRSTKTSDRLFVLSGKVRAVPSSGAQSGRVFDINPGRILEIKNGRTSLLTVKTSQQSVDPMEVLRNTILKETGPGTTGRKPPVKNTKTAIPRPLTGKIFLTDGSVITGSIISQTAAGFTIKSKYGIMKIERNRVQRVQYLK